MLYVVVVYSVHTHLLFVAVVLLLICPAVRPLLLIEFTDVHSLLLVIGPTSVLHHRH